MKRLYRSRSERTIAGVAGGIAEYFSIDPVIVRLGIILLFVATGFLPIIVAYAVAVVIVPKEPEYTITRDSEPDDTKAV